MELVKSDKNELMGMARFNAMLLAVSECHKVDEVKDIRDATLAMEVYAKQASNVSAELMANEVRLRAERQCGKLLKKMEMQKAGEYQQSSNDTSLVVAPKLSDIGISHDQSSRFQKLADISDEEFDSHFNFHEYISDPDGNPPPVKPTTTKVIREHKEKVTPIKDKRIAKQRAYGVRVWGELESIMRVRDAQLPFKEFIPLMSNHMIESGVKSIAEAMEWLTQLDKEMRDEYSKR